MPEQQSTGTSNVYFNLVSILYHSLQSAQTAATYVSDAQASGDQDLVQFFQDFQQTTNQQAERAKQLLTRLGSQS
jgi:hypothetical protein